MIIAATRYGSAGGASKLPAYTYTGLAPIERKAETGDNWELIFQRPANAPSGPTTTITFSKNVDVEIFAVGGGQPGSAGEDAFISADGNNYFAYGGAGGNGGETKTATKQLTKDVAYSVTVGGPGMSTSFDNVTAASGAGAAGGVGARTRDSARNGGAGGDGAYAFGDANTLYNPGAKYGPGGGGGSAGASATEKPAGAGGTTGGGAGGGISGTHSAGANGQANTGAGGGGGSAFAYVHDSEGCLAGGLGGSGIVIIRNVRAST